MASAGSTRSRVQRSRRFDAMARGAGRARSRRARQPPIATLARSSWRFSLASSTSAGAEADPGEDEELSALRQVLASAERVERLCAESYASLYERTTRCSPALGGGVAAGRRSSRRSTRSSGRISTRATASSRSSRISPRFLRKYADGIEASPARLQQVEERLALLERLKRKHGPTLADVDRAARGASTRARRLAARRRADCRPRARHRARRARRTSSGRARLLAGERRRAAKRFARHSRRCSPSWRWSRPGSRCGSTRTRCPRRRGRPRASIARSSSCRRIPARISGRWRGSCRAASCRASCSRSRR